VNGVRKMAAKNELKEAVSLTKEDYFNIMSWLAHSVEMAEGGLRGPIRNSERYTIMRIKEAKKKLDMRKKDVS